MTGKASSSIGVVTVLVGIIAYIIYQKVAVAKNLSFKFRKIDFQGNFLNPQIFLTVTLQNNTTGSVTVENIVGGVFNESNLKIASVNSTNEIKIKPKSQVDIVLKIDPAVADFITAIKTFTNNQDAIFNFVGTITADRLPIPVKASYSLKELLNGI